MMVVLVCTQQQDVLCMVSVLSYKFVLTHNQLRFLSIQFSL